ncbi:serine O-acetyltransferase [Rossellomorea aquimaris]|uniref:serine O-acetyltransferase n=1 Tax=Rossellomorea aquimaris TaxID=189382 RepID=UPI003CFA120A
MFTLIKSDYKAYGLSFKGLIMSVFNFSTFWLVVLYRMSHYLYKKRIPILPRILRSIGIIFYGAEISQGAEIGPGFRIAHSVGVVIGTNVKAGAHLEVFQNVTIGGRDQERNGQIKPIIGDNVTIFTGAVVAGPVTVGHNVSVGANAVVTADIASNLVVAGVPAKPVGEVRIPHSLRSMNRVI